MLQPLPSPGPLHPEAHFYDPFHRTLYYLQAGALRAHLQAQNRQQTIPIHLSAPPSNPLSFPALLTISGEVVSNAYGNIVATSSEEATVRSSVAVTANSHWEWHVPLSLSNISLGICKMKDEQIEGQELIQFNSSTARTVTFYLKQKELNVWVNGTRPGKKSIRTIDFDQTTHRIYPFAKIKERGSTLIFSPFLTTLISDLSSYNPFGALYLQEPKAQSQVNDSLHQQVKIAKLIGLSADRMLLVWDNNRVQVICRDKNSRQFLIPQTYVQNSLVYGLFSQEQHNLLEQWRGQKSLFKLNPSISLKSAFQWLRFLISQLDNEKSQRKDLYRLLLAKLLAIRPYLPSIGITLPNLSIHCESDIARYLSALPYFQGFRNIKKTLLNVPASTAQKDIEGEIKCISSNYLLTLRQKTVIIYYIGNGIKEIFRENLKHFNFNKRTLVDSYDEADLRYIQKDGSYLYKILTSSFNGKKKQEETYIANPKDVQQLVSMFKIEEKAAITALEHTGNVEEALVWIFTQKKDENSQKDCLNEQGDETEHEFAMLQLKSKFTRLLLSVNKVLYVLGVTPKQIHRLIQRGESEFIDLVSLKHENSIDDIDYDQWYQGANHPQLHLLDSIQLNQKPELLVTSNNKTYSIFTAESTRYKQEVALSIDHLFELKQSINLTGAEMLLNPQLQEIKLIRSIQGELISPEVDDHFYEPNTTVLMGQKLFSNSNFPGSAAVRLTVQIAAELLRQSVDGKSHMLPLTIEHGPPGVNKNYSIANILTSKGSFLGNYPQGLRLRHLHNLVMNLSSLKLRRCIHRKNINYIQQGVIYFKDIWGLTSEHYPFKFQSNQEEITIVFGQGQYWKEMFLEPKFTTLKKLPYQIGSFTAEGKCLSEDAYQRLYQQKLSILLNSHSTQRIFLHRVAPIQKNILELDVTCANLEYLQSFNIKSEQMSILNKNGVTWLKEAVNFQQIQSLKPVQIMKYMSKNYTKISTFLRHLSRSHFFSLDRFQQPYVRQFVDLVIFSLQQIDSQQYYQSMFTKIWENNHGRQYLLTLASALCQAPVFPRQYLPLLLARLPQKHHEHTLKSALAAVSKIRSKEYTKLGNQSPYLYYETQLYSDYYFNLVDPVKNPQKEAIFSQSLIKSEIAVFKSDFTRRIIVKLPATYLITDFTLRIQRCDTTSKVHYTIFTLNAKGKNVIGSGFIQEHQWSQIAQLPYKQDLQKAYDTEFDSWNAIGVQVQKITAQYIEIELRFTETGIIGHQSQTSRITQVDILPELYGHEVQKGSPLPAVEQLLGFNPEDMFFLSVSKLLKTPMKKYSISKGKSLEFLYYTPEKEDIGALKALLLEKIKKSELQAIANIQRKLIANNSYSHKVSLDYLYTIIALTLSQLQKSNVKVEDDICQKIFSTIVEVAQGPIKIIGFKTISLKIHLLIKSLQYIERELQSLGEISFSYEQLVETTDFSNPDLCKSLTRLILRGVPYQQKWAELLIRMSARTEAHQEILGYFIEKQDWLKNQQILDYISSLPDQIYVNSFLNLLSYSNLSKLVLTASAKPRLDMLLEAVVQRASNDNPVDLDVISLIFQQDEVRWEQLQTVIGSCPQATDTVIHQFLQSDIPEVLARQNRLLFQTASSPKYAEEFAVFLEKIYRNNRRSLVELILSLNDTCTTLHYDALEIIGRLITDLCFFGGLEGVRLIGHEGVSNLQAAVFMLKIVQKLPEGAELPNEDLLIDWYLKNNDFQLTAANPAHKTPAHHLMKQLVDQVLALIKTSQPSKVLTKYMASLNDLKGSKRISPIKRHLMFSQLHHGASTLLAHTLTPGSLANVFSSGETPLLISIVNELKANALKRCSKSGKWLPTKQIDISENFQVQKFTELKDLQVGKGGSKMPGVKIPITQKKLRLVSDKDHFPTKLTIGFCLNDHADNKQAILPSKVEVFAGNEKTMLKIGDMILIEDQFYLSYGVTVFGLNLNTAYALGLHSIKNVEFKFYDPLLCSASEVLEGGQKTKKGATYNISFISLHGYDSQPTDEPDYSLMYVTLLGFLGQQKYKQDLREVIKMPQFDQKLELIIQVLNDLLPNQEIEELLLGLNREGENILQYVLKSKGANPKLVNSLILGKLTKENINKLIEHTLSNISDEFVNIVTLSVRLASYSLPSRHAAETVSDFENVKLLLEKYEQSKNNSRELYQRLINSLLTVPNLYHYDLSKFISLIWSKTQRHRFYPLLAAILPYYPSQLDNCSTKKYVIEVVDELQSILLQNQKANAVVTDPLSHIQLICTMSLNNSCRQQLLQRKDPIKIMELIKSSESILVKYSNDTMRLFISFFQITCIGTSCQDEFSQILINVMTSLNQFNPVHHNYFIHSFFFPLINAFKGVPVLFVWKHNHHYLKQITDILQTHPIRSNSAVILFKEQFYHPLESIDKHHLASNLLFVEKETEQKCYQLKKGTLIDISVNKQRKYEFKDGKVVIEVSETENIILVPEKFKVYEQNEWQKNLLTNSTLLSLNNPWVFTEKYHGVLPIKDSTSQRCYFLPQEMEIGELLKQINICGFKIHPLDLPQIKLKNYITGKDLSQKESLKMVINEQKEPYLKIEIQATEVFKSSTIESLAKEQAISQPFVAQETIFKAFQQKQGLQKMITVLKGCVKNWTSPEQSNIWGQYLKELESYSCFPVFSSLYINKQSNVALLFDILLGLPDKQDPKKWLQKQKQSVKELYMIIKDVFSVKGQQALVVRQYAMKSGFYSTMLQRLHMITKEPKRFKVAEDKIEEDVVLPSLEKKPSEDDFKSRLQKRQGVGYGTDSSSNQKWDVTGQEEARKEKSQQILSLLTILEQFFDCDSFKYPSELLDQTYESALLPIIESSLRGGSLLEISKFAELFKRQLSFIQVLAKCSQLVTVLMPIPKFYEPRQPESLYSLLKTLANTSKIFMACLTGSASEKTSEQIAKKIITTYELVQEAISQYETAHYNEDDEERKIMELPLPKKYPLLMKDLRFDYIDMKDSSNKISKHHYASNYQPGHKPPVDKTIRLAQELADLSHALPIDHTNAIYVRCDKERVDFMQALIMGSNGTPYGHGAYLFDIYFEDSYPNGPPKVNLMTTGSGQIRFNPNLYACGKVCLSLLGTWRGNAMENWDSKVSTLLQVLVSIQSIIMSEDIYFNEPGFEHEAGTPEGQKKNQAYANIVRYGNVKFAMLQNIKNPPKGFQSVIRRHFFLKKDEILQECQRWLKLAQKRQASYNGLVSDHNYNWCNNFKKSKTEYKTMLEKAVKELEQELRKLPPPTHQDFKKQNNSPTKPKKKVQKPIIEENIEPVLEEIDVSYGATKEYEELDINDEKVKDRWSRYIGAMGVEAVTKQSKASIVLLGLGAVGVETAKNIVLSGCKELAIWDDKLVKYSDLSGQFFLGQSDVGNSRLESSFYKLQELNHYVKMTKFDYHPDDLNNFNSYQLVIATQRSYEQLLKLNAHCHSNKIHFISADCYGPYGQIFNDFGDNFEILDKDGEEPTEVLIEEISIGEKGVVKLVKGYRHPYEDGDTVRIAGVKGMKSLTKEGQSINGTLHKIKVIDPNSFEIENTTDYTPYEGEGTVKNMKTIRKISFKPLEEVQKEPNIDSNLEYYDWSKSSKLKLLHTLFLALSDFTKQYLRLPLSWNKEDATNLIQLTKKRKAELSQQDIKYIKLFSYTCSGTFGSICAFFGGIVAQEAFKAITGKYTPINQYFLAEFSEIIELPPDDQEGWNNYVSTRLPVQDRTQGLRRIIGADLIKTLENCKLFMVGSGAIGCELLKNFAMIELGAGSGSITVTDPDHIETSNLNRQFLFREKHLRKPKSATATAAVIQMNPRLKGHIKAKLDKVCEATRDIFSNEFFEGLDIVANALDNVEARRYVDTRCVESKVALLESGTLSSKGHVQVIIPYKTETYGNMQDPNDAQGDIPHCTLKMFPEQTLHCVEWARDLFGKEFTLGPKALRKLLDADQSYTVGPSDIQMLRECIKLIKSRPHNFEDAIEVATKVFYQLYRNDIMQLLYTYPLDAKTKDGKPFWKLPKRPPTPIEQIDPNDPLHNSFLSSYAVLIAKIYGIPFPKDFRSHERRQQIAETARKIKVEPFVPSDKAAKEMAEEVNKQSLGKEEVEQAEEMNQGQESEQVLYASFKELVQEIKQEGEIVESKHEEFEKDDDQNGHIDLISSMANLRARNYKLEEMEWITVKLKAGRIMPALSTTTSCIAALQTIELVKYLRGCSLESMRNSFLNLAIPSLTMGEPGPVQKIKVHENLETNIWQRWSVGPLSKNDNIGQLIKAIQVKYGVTVKGLTLAEGGQIYSDFVMSLESKKEEKEKLLKKTIEKLISEQFGDQPCKFLDFTLVMGVGETLIKHAPTVRLLLQN